MSASPTAPCSPPATPPSPTTNPAPTPRAVRMAQDRILADPQLDHLLGVNQFFTDPIAHARTHPASRLLRWRSAERTVNARSPACWCELSSRTTTDGLVS